MTKKPIIPKIQKNRRERLTPKKTGSTSVKKMFSSQSHKVVPKFSQKTKAVNR